MHRACGFVVILALLTACERPGNPEQTRVLASKALSGTLAYPRSTLVSVSAGDEAAQLVLSSPDSVTVVAKWFLQALPLNHWDVKRSVNDRNGTVTIYAEQEKRPLWLTLRPNVGAPATDPDRACPRSASTGDRSTDPQIQSGHCGSSRR